MAYFLFFAFISFAIVAFGQPAWASWLSPLAAAIGYAIFWRVLLNLKAKRMHLFLIATLWYMGVQLVQLSWMTSIEFHGFYILGVYAGLSFCLGLIFGLFTYILARNESLTWMRIGALAGLWTLMEWGRYNIMCGFSWNPAGIALAAYPLTMQLAAIAGVLGLSFWVMLTNLVGLKELWDKTSPERGFLKWLGIALVPYIFGTVYLMNQNEDLTTPPSKVALVQTGLLPSQKIPLQGRLHEYLSPWIQWQRIFSFLKDGQSQHPALIVLPEYTVPFMASAPVYDHETALYLIEREFGKKALEALPPLQRPFAELREKKYFVTNAFFSQFLANYFQAEIVIGMDDRDAETSRSYSAGLYFQPGNPDPRRYEKRILVPLAEYLPFEWCRPLVEGYGITDFYTHGKEAKVFSNHQPFALSICYEETFPEIMREGKLRGAELFINLTNDNWYPHSKLSRQHFDHARLRAVENGTPLVRACNSGVTAVVDASGRIVDELKSEDGVLYADVPRDSFSTLYTQFGDALIVGISFGLIGAYLLFRKKTPRKKKFTLADWFLRSRLVSLLLKKQFLR